MPILAGSLANSYWPTDQASKMNEAASKKNMRECMKQKSQHLERAVSENPQGTVSYVHHSSFGVEPGQGGCFLGCI